MTNSACRATFPDVATVVRKMLAVPATFIASERPFSKAGDVITKKCTTIHQLLRQTSYAFSWRTCDID